MRPRTFQFKKRTLLQKGNILSICGCSITVLIILVVLMHFFHISSSADGRTKSKYDSRILYQEPSLKPTRVRGFNCYLFIFLFYSYKFHRQTTMRHVYVETILLQYYY